MDPQQIFRKAALDKLSSPEQLDQLMHVTAPRSWIALAACCALVLTALVWSIFGRIPTKVEARGILLKQGGVFLASSRGDGNVIEILVRMGASVSSNQVLARVSQSELDLRISQAAETLTRYRREFEQLKTYHADELRHEKKTFDKQRETFQGIVEDYKKQIGWLRQRVESQNELEKKGLVTRAQVLETQIKLSNTQHDMESANVQLGQVEINELQSQERRRQAIQDKDNQIKNNEDQLHYLKNLHTLNTEIRSPFSGNVIEIMAKPGQLLTPNTPILSLQEDHPQMEACLFLPPAQGKLVQPGMHVAISPVSVKKEEYGFVSAKVDSASQFPSTPQRMSRILENQALVAEFSLGGAPIEVIAILEDSTNTVSGYKWSSIKGPPTKITSGTICDAWITLTNQRPISLLLPMFKNVVGM